MTSSRNSNGSDDALEKMRSILSEGQRIAHVGSFEYVAETQSTIWSEEEFLIYGLDPKEPSPAYEVLLAKHIHPDDAAQLHETFSAALQSQTIYELEHRIVRPDGSVRWVYDRAHPYFDEAGKLVRYIGATLDVTERKLVQEELRQKNLQLAEADAHKNEFLAMLSHELRNPLACMATSLSVLDHAVPEDARRAKQVLERQVVQLTNLVNDLLDVSRISKGKIRLRKELLDLNEVVRRVVQDNGSLFERAAIRLDFVSAPKPVSVLADRTRVAQMVTNLLQNAAKFTGKGGVTRVSITADEDEAIVSVADDGIGMDGPTLARVFEPFMQVEETQSRKGGLGLGLALVRRLAELHGGSAMARSDGLGAGAELVVRLPLAKGVVVAEARRQTFT